MRDTPRTDALIYRKNTIEMQRHELLDLALALERELAEAVAAERERCAKECIEMADDFELEVNQRGLVEKMKKHFGVK